MSDITEEEIAMAIARDEYCCEPEDVPNLYAKALSTARLVMALLQPALERARREERERVAKRIDKMAANLRRRMTNNHRFDHIEISAKRHEQLAAAIRKG